MDRGSWYFEKEKGQGRIFGCLRLCHGPSLGRGPPVLMACLFFQTGMGFDEKIGPSSTSGPFWKKYSILLLRIHASCVANFPGLILKLIRGVQKASKMRDVAAGASWERGDTYDMKVRKGVMERSAFVLDVCGTPFPPIWNTLSFSLRIPITHYLFSNSCFIRVHRFIGLLLPLSFLASILIPSSPYCLTSVSLYPYVSSLIITLILVPR